MMDNYAKLKQQGLAELEKLEDGQIRMNMPVYNAEGKQCDGKAIIIPPGTADQYITSIQNQIDQLQLLLDNYITLGNVINVLINE